MNPVFTDKISLDNSKQREYLKQQQQLRNMTKSSPAISADDMIESLLSKKEIFQKKKETSQPQKSSSIMDPVWLSEGKEPAAYRKVWEQVCTPAGLTDTPKLSFILLGSGLATDTLGYIWSLTNTTVSGALTKIELFRTLALVALAQKGYSFTNLLVLSQFHEAPTPRLDLRPSVPITTGTQNQTPPTGALPSTTSLPLLSIPQVPTVTETLSLLDTLTEPSVPASIPTSSTVPTSAPSLSVLSATDLNRLSGPSQPTVPSSVADDDEFDDFKSADIFTAESLTVLDIKDNASLPTDNLRNEDLFKTNFTSYLFQVEKKSVIDDGILFSPDFDDDKKPTSDSTSNTSSDSGSKKDSSTFTTSSLQEALREDLTLAPVTLPYIAPPVPSAPVESDRYNALRQLAAGNEANSTESTQEDFYDDFGDFITASQPVIQDSIVVTNSLTSVAQSSSVASDLQEKCLEACVLVLREANDLFKSIDDPKVIAEVLSDDRGKKYIEEIIEVERIGRRIISSRTDVQTNDCELCKQLEYLCKSLEPFTKPLEHTHMEEEKGAKCGLCQCEIGPAHVKYGINQFHAPCANLFLHVTGELLPLTPVT